METDILTVMELMCQAKAGLWNGIQCILIPDTLPLTGPQGPRGVQ